MSDRERAVEAPEAGESDERPIRKAATVIVARDGEDGMEVLLLRRGPRNRFLPGYVVFPGGALDPEDDELAERWFGTPEEAPRAGAVRELIEEAGLVLTAAGLAEVGADGDAAAVLASIDADPPPPGLLPKIAHWVAPVDVPVRFDAHYFAVEAPPALEPTPDGDEADRAWWGRPIDVMEDWAERRVKLYWPTMKTMEVLTECRTAAELLSTWIEQREPELGDEERMPRSTFYQEP